MVFFNKLNLLDLNISRDDKVYSKSYVYLQMGRINIWLLGMSSKLIFTLKNLIGMVRIKVE